VNLTDVPKSIRFQNKFLNRKITTGITHASKKHWRNFGRKIIIEDRSSVSNIVTSIMMLGIFLSILAMIFTVYVPNWAKSGEANHMGKAMDSFLDLKSTIDKQIVDEKGVGSTYKTQIKLGAEGGSILGIGRTSGTLAYHNSGFNINIYNTEDPQNIYGQGSGKITFEPRNVYYANQYFTYENGAVIVEQDLEGVMRAKPNFDISYSNNRTIVVITIVHLSGTSENVGGTGYHTIDSKLIQSTAQSHELIWSADMGFDYGQNITINVSTKFGDLWKELIEAELEDLPNDVKVNKTTLSMVSRDDPQTNEKIYDVILTLNEIYKLDCKKGTMEIKLN
jgi:hypothetical protein